MRRGVGGRPVFWISVVAGWAVIAFGARGALVDHVLTHPAALVRWVLAGLVVHDGLWVPAALALAVLAGRGARGPGRAPLLWATATSAVVAVVAWPFVRGYGRQPANPSLLPRNYAVGLAVYLAVIIVGAILWWALAARRGRASQ